MADLVTVRLIVNGVEREGRCEPRTLLADFLREDLGLTGTHVGCEHGICGACTILVDGQAARSCLMLAVQARGTQLTTIEGLARDGTLSPLQEAFRAHHGLQCGFCTPGMLMTALDLLRVNPAPTDAEIREGLSAVLCRCTGYQGIVDAVRAAARIPEARETRGYLEIPARLNIGEWVTDRHVREGRGQRPAVHAGDRVYSFEELRRLANRAAHALSELGVARGDRVLLRLGTSLDCMLAFLGASRLGAVPIPTSLMLRAGEVGAILDNCRAAVAVVAPEGLEAVEAVRPGAPWLRHVLVGGDGGDPAHSFRARLARGADEIAPADTGPDDPAFMVYSSGTTGTPKGVEHAHRWIIGTGDPITRAMMQLGPDDVCYQPQDWSFIYALGCNFLFPFHAGASVVLPGPRFAPAEAVAAIERHRVSVFCAVPTIYRMMLAAPEATRERLRSLRMGVSAGEPLPADTFEEWRRRLGVTVYDGLGQSENHIFLANQLDKPVKPGSLGTPLPGYRVAIVDEDGKPAPPGQPGHLVVGNDHPGLALGYYRDPERWAAVNRGGWYDTKDFASVDEDGCYWYVSRSDDLIKSRGYLISPKEVESTLMDHPVVLEAGVVGVPDPVIGQKVCAWVTLRPGVEASPALSEELKTHARSTIAPFKAPQEVIVVDELPKTLTGKVLRRELRARGAAR